MIKFLTFLVVCGTLVTGCATYKPYDFRPIDDIPDRPGLFSGRDGTFVIVGDAEKS